MIDLLPNSEQQQIIDSVVTYFNASMPVSRLRPGTGSGREVTAAQWRDIAELGWFGMGVPEDLGGVGFSIVEEMLIAYQMGRYLVSPALAGAMLAAHVAVHAGAAELYAGIVAGDCRIGLARALLPRLSGFDGEYHLLDAEAAEMVVLWRNDGAGIFARSAFRDRHSAPSFDESIGLERGWLKDVKPLAWVPAADHDLPRLAVLFAAAQLAGIADAACALAVEYAKIRKQFGQPIGSFQAIKHHCADMAVAAEAAYAQTAFATLLVAAGAAGAGFQSAAAATQAARAALMNARGNIQIHGGIGFTSECDAHWFLKRAHVLEQFAGTAAMHRDSLLALEVA